MKHLYNAFFIISVVFLLAFAYALKPFNPRINNPLESPIVMTGIQAIHKQLSDDIAITITAEDATHHFKNKTTLLKDITATTIRDGIAWTLTADKATDMPDEIIIEGNIDVHNNQPNPVSFQTNKLIIDKKTLDITSEESLTLNQPVNDQCMLAKAKSGTFNLKSQLLTLQQQVSELQNSHCSLSSQTNTIS